MRYLIKRFIMLRFKDLENKIRTFKLKSETRQAYSAGKALHTLIHYLIMFSIIAVAIASLVTVSYLGVKEYGNFVAKVKSLTSNMQKKIVEGRKKREVKKSEEKVKEIKRPIDKVKPKPTTEGMPFFIFVNKSTKKFYLLKNINNEWKVFRKYNIGIGADPKRKEKTGDNRTPEGQYFVVGRKEKSELTKIYGPLAFVLNYPNEIDKSEGRTGYGIWIHGTDPEQLPYQSKGCLELLNRDATELGVILKDGIGTPVLIVNVEGLDSIINYPDYKSIAIKRKEILDHYNRSKEICQKIVLDWSNAWQSRDIETYSSFYDTLNFSGKRLKWDSWREKKLATFNYYKTINVKVSNLFLSEMSERMLAVKFLQEYRSDKIHSVSGKKLKLFKIGSEWKIRSENSFPRQELLL